MSVIITQVSKHSIADKLGIEGGWTLLTINGNEICDVLDFRFYETERRVELVLTDRGGAERRFEVRKQEYEQLGLEFETYLMDKQRHCKNKCVFCFIDQLPKGLRESLYFKDDDDRLSFLFGNYITLTNITDREIERIIKMHISPINISVHTTNPELRVRMMRNPNAGESLRLLERLAEAGIKLNCQLVLCPEMNDGDELRRSLDDLLKLAPSVSSIALVPVGLTKHREGLYPLRLFTPEECGSIIDTAEEYAARALERHGTRIVHAADEIYLKAGRPLPDADYYEEFAQLENGVGLVTLLRTEFESALKAEEGSNERISLSIATGTSAAPILAEMLDAVKEKWHNLDCRLYAVKNEFLGETITVAGLVTGGDIIKQLSGRPLGERLLIPRAMLRSEGDLFLDDVSLEQLQRALNVPVIPVGNDGGELLDAITGTWHS